MKQYHNTVNKIGNILSLESKINIVGSAGIKRSIYYSDYDLFKSIKNKSVTVIHNHFKSIFEIIKRMPKTIITDFKLGVDSRGDSLRWSYNNVMNGVNNGYTLKNA